MAPPGGRVNNSKQFSSLSRQAVKSREVKYITKLVIKIRSKSAAVNRKVQNRAGLTRATRWRLPLCRRCLHRGGTREITSGATASKRTELTDDCVWSSTALRWAPASGRAMRFPRSVGLIATDHSTEMAWAGIGTRARETQSPPSSPLSRHRHDGRSRQSRRQVGLDRCIATFGVVGAGGRESCFWRRMQADKGD